MVANKNSSSSSIDNDIETILWSADHLSQKVTHLANQITHDFSQSLSPPVIVGVATGAFLFLADLVRAIKLPVTVDFVRAESYGSGTVSNGAPKVSCDVKLDVTGKHVVLVEDIVDTGNTVARLISYLQGKGATSVSVCTLLDKPARRKVHFDLLGDGKFYTGFECPDSFVVGYGLDFNERYRNLPYIGGKCFVIVSNLSSFLYLGNDGDGNIVHKGNVSDTNLVDKALVDNVGETRDVDMLVVDNVGETRDVDMLVVDNVVNSNLVDNGKGVSIDDEVVAKHMKLDNGNSIMTQKDHVISKKRKSVSKCNGIVIRENDNPLFDSDNDSDSDGDTIKQHELCMEELMWKLKGNGSGLTDPFTIVRELCQMFSIYDEETHWKMKKLKFGECLTYYAFANGFSLWFYKSCKNKMIAKCDQMELLTTVGRDGNNHIFHVTWDVVTIENKDNQSWFLELLADDLEISNCFGLTLMSDQHKGLIKAVEEVMPLAKHMQCARHIYEGFCKQFRRGCDAVNADELARTCSCRMGQLSEIVNNAIDEVERDASTKHVVFNNGRRIELGKNWNKNKKGDKSNGTSFVNMRGGKTNRGRLIRAQRLRRLERWLRMDVGTSNPESKPLHASYLDKNNNNNINDAMNVASTQQSQVVGVHEPRYEANKGTKVRVTKSAIIDRRMKTTSATLANPQPRQQRRRAQAPFVQPRAKSQKNPQQETFCTNKNTWIIQGQ
uniref:hypoxanthine phosphoribosyltransferase n=1 Tax=Tanacetum cinerariifolium TaxID=118510 RepID=A0A6L2J8G2_TANCI|nr:hypoxanthine-guanine phosphoribosyltransferase [Tanacetum cinerariifolium]